MLYSIVEVELNIFLLYYLTTIIVEIVNDIIYLSMWIIIYI